MDRAKKRQKWGHLSSYLFTSIVMFFKMSETAIFLYFLLVAAKGLSVWEIYISTQGR